MEREDELLVADGLGGSRQALDELIGRYERPIYNVVRRLVGRNEDARDISQTVFLKAIQNLRSFDPQYRFRSWITRIAVNECLNHIQRRKVTEPLNDTLLAAADGPVEIMKGAELSRTVDGALQRLAPDQRVVIVLRYFHDLSYHDMAAVLEISEKTVKSRLFSSRMRLRETLAGMGVLGN